MSCLSIVGKNLTTLGKIQIWGLVSLRWQHGFFEIDAENGTDSARLLGYFEVERFASAIPVPFLQSADSHEGYGIANSSETRTARSVSVLLAKPQVSVANNTETGHFAPSCPSALLYLVKHVLDFFA